MLAGLRARSSLGGADRDLERQAHAKGIDTKTQVVLLEKVGSLFSEKLATPTRRSRRIRRSCA
jgi:hypothetical protein